MNIEELANTLSYKNLSELVDRYIYGKKNNWFMRLLKGRTRYLKNNEALRILRDVIRALPEDKQRLTYFESLVYDNDQLLLLLAINICKRDGITLGNEQVEEEEPKLIAL